MALNGASAGNYREYADSADYDNAQVTVSCWVNVLSTFASGARMIVARWNGLAAGAWRLEANKSGDDLNFEFGIGISGSGDVSATDTTPINLNQWYHLVGVYNQTNALLYVDGSLTTGTAATGAASSIALPIRLFEQTGGSNHLDCEIAEVAAWNTGGITADEVTALAGGVLPWEVRQDNLYLYDPCHSWSFDYFRHGTTDAGTLSEPNHPPVSPFSRRLWRASTPLIEVAGAANPKGVFGLALDGPLRRVVY